MIDVLDPKDIARENKFATRAALVALIVVLVSESAFTGGYRLIGAFGLIALVIFGFQAIFYSSTLFAFRLQGKALQHFQIGIAIGFPAILTSYFYYRAAMIDLRSIATEFSSMWILLPTVILVAIGRAGATQLHRTYPFRGYLLAAAAMFVLCVMWEQGYYFEEAYDGEGSDLLRDPERAQTARTTGLYVIKYPLYVALLYVGMLSKQLQFSRT